MHPIDRRRGCPCKAALTLVGIILLLAEPLKAQPADPPCGGIEDKQAALGFVKKYFFDDEFQAVREALSIEKLPTNAPVSVVEDKGACGRALGATMRQIREKGREKGRSEFEFAVFRFGPFLAVLLDEPLPEGEEFPPSGTIQTGFARLMIFRAQDLSFVGAILV